MKREKCPFCSIPCGEDHCAWEEPKPDPKPEKQIKEKEDKDKKK